MLHAFVVAHPMFEEVALPLDALALGQTTFPQADDLRDGFFRRDADEKMDMVGHEDGDVAKPMVPFVVEADEVEDRGSDFRMAEVVLVAEFSANRKEKFGFGADPKRRVVIETFAGEHWR